MLDQGGYIVSSCENQDQVSTLMCDTSRHCCLHRLIVATVSAHDEGTVLR